MKNKFLIFLILLPILFISACSSNSQSNNQNIQDQLNVPTPGYEDINERIVNEEAKIDESNKLILIEISNFAFDSKTITIKEGTTVRWTQKDSTKHTVTSDAEIFDSGLLSNGQVFNYKFDKSGVYSYHCTPHPYMKGTIIVQ